MFVSTSCSVFLALGQLVFQRRLEVNLSSVAPPDLIKDIISAGATNFRSVLPTSTDLHAIVEAYGEAATQAFVSAKYHPTHGD